MKYFCSSFASVVFAACNNERKSDRIGGGNQPVDVVMSVALPGPSTHCRHG